MVSSLGPPNKQWRKMEHKNFSQTLTYTPKRRLQRLWAFEKKQKEQESQPHVKVKIKLEATKDPLSNKKGALMQKTEGDVVKIQNTRGAFFPRETEEVFLEESSGEVINTIIMIFSIVIDNKKSLNVLFMENLIEVLSFKMDYFAWNYIEMLNQVVEYYLL